MTGSFKARGASNKVALLDTATRSRGLVTASGGNHGLGVAYAGGRANVPVRVYLPASVTRTKIQTLETWGAKVVVHGEVFDDAQTAAQCWAAEHGATYVHPFCDPAVIAGQGTVGLEILKQCADVDTVLVATGGGGLISGVSLAMKGLNPGVRVIGVEPVGAPTVQRSLEANGLVTLDCIDTAAGSLAPRRTEQLNLDIIQGHVDQIILVDDQEMAAAAAWLWFEMGLAIELGAAAGLAALRTGKYAPADGENLCVILCGAGYAGLTIAGVAQ